MLTALLAAATHAATVQIRREGLGWLGAEGWSVLWWADNCFVLARSMQEARTMFSRLTRALRAAQLSWKPASLELMRAAPLRGEAGPSARAVRFEVDDRCYEIRQVAALKVLGHVINAEAAADVELDAALAQGDRAWWANAAVWRSPWLSPAAKCRAFGETCAAAVAAAAGGLHLGTPALRRIRAWEQAKLRRLVRYRRRGTEEEAGAYWRAAERRITEVAQASGLVRLCRRLLLALHARAGQLAAAACEQAEPLSEIRVAVLQIALRVRDHEWQDRAPMMQSLDPGNELRWKHRRPGRPAEPWEALLVEVVGRDWRETAAAEGTRRWAARASAFADKVLADRLGAKAAQAPAPAGAALPEPEAAPLAAAAPAHREFAADEARWTFEAVTDALNVAESHRGRVRPPGGAAARSWRQAELAMGALAAAGVRWRGLEPLVWHPRALNAAADALAKEARDRGCRLAWADSTRAHRGGRLRLFTDGSRTASRSGWAALLLVDDGGLWRPWAAVGEGHHGPDALSVPEAEHRAVAEGLAWAMAAVAEDLAEVAARWATAALWAPGAVAAAADAASAAWRSADAP